MPRSQFSSPRPEPTFLNRADEKRLFKHHVKLLQEDPEHLMILEVVGLGGAGKTRLLSHLRKDVSRRRSGSRHVVKIFLEEEASTTETGPLLQLPETTSY